MNIVRADNARAGCNSFSLDRAISVTNGAVAIAIIPNPPTKNIISFIPSKIWTVPVYATSVSKSPLFGFDSLSDNFQNRK